MYTKSRGLCLKHNLEGYASNIIYQEQGLSIRMSYQEQGCPSEYHTKNMSCPSECHTRNSVVYQNVILETGLSIRISYQEQGCLSEYHTRNRVVHQNVIFKMSTNHRTVCKRTRWLTISNRFMK